MDTHGIPPPPKNLSCRRRRGRRARSVLGGLGSSKHQGHGRAWARARQRAHQQRAKNCKGYGNYTWKGTIATGDSSRYGVPRNTASGCGTRVRYQPTRVRNHVAVPGIRYHYTFSPTEISSWSSSSASAAATGAVSLARGAADI